MNCIVPVNDKIVIKKLEVADDNQKIVLPEDSKEKPVRAEVLAVGPGAFNFHVIGGERLPMSVRVGEVIAYNSYAGQEIEVGRETYFLISDNDVLCVFPKCNCEEK